MFKFAIPALALAAALATPALANVPIYNTPGTGSVNAQPGFSYTAAADGELKVWYLGGRSVGYTHALFASFDGGSSWAGPAQSSDSDLEGTSFSFGPIDAGTPVEFKLLVSKPNKVAGTEVFTDPSKNSPVQNLAFYSDWGGGSFTYIESFFGAELNGSIPLGEYTYVAFEDIVSAPFRARDEFGNRQDYDYNDYRFAFRLVPGNVVPEPATWAMLITGFGLVGFAMRRRKSTLASVSA